MVKKAIEFTAKKREKTGKAHMRRMRRFSDVVPGVVYGGGNNKGTELITLAGKAVAKHIGQEALYTQVIVLDIEGHKQKVVVKEVQTEPTKPRTATHIDFQRVSATEKLTMKIPLHFIGEDKAPGVKEEGGVVSHNLSEVEVRCLPDDLPEAIEVDLSGMALNQIFHLTDLTLPPNIELVALSQGEEDHNLPVASIHPPKVSEEATDETAEDTDATDEEGDNKKSTASSTNDTDTTDTTKS